VIILPVMVANTVSYFISRRLHPVPFFTMLAPQEGVDLPSVEEFRSVAVMRVEDAMRSLPPGIELDGVPRVYPDVTLDAAMRLLSSDRILLVTSRADRDTPIGVLTLEDVFRAYGLIQSRDESD
jgi:hypothetical protein